jgi:hypothetical protein
MRTEMHSAPRGRVRPFLLTAATLVASLAVMVGHTRGDWTADATALRQLAQATVASAEVKPGAKISRGSNTTGRVLHLPGGSGSYPAFWIRDAAMMLGGDLIPADEIEGWIRVIAATQPGPQGLSLQHGLFVPAYSIPDHVNVNGKAVWFPGTYADGDDQGDGQYGHLPPADDAFYFVQMVREHLRLTSKPDLLATRVPTAGGAHSVMEICDRAFESVAVDPATGIVICDATPGRTRVDWGFCDSVRKTGLALVPTILRFRAAGELADMHEALGEPTMAAAYQRTAAQLREAVAKTFLRKIAGDEALLISATGLGCKYDVWGSALAVAEGILPAKEETAVCRGLLSLYKTGGIVAEGQVRAMPPSGPLGGFWEQAATPPGHYQNGAYWGTMSGWLIVALHQVEPTAAQAVLHELVASVTRDRPAGAPWEWVNPALGLQRNPLYCATVALPYTTLRRCGLVKE